MIKQETKAFGVSIIRGLRELGYTPEISIADIIDNSIAHKAKNIEVCTEAYHHNAIMYAIYLKRQQELQLNPESFPSEGYLNMIQTVVANHQRYFDARQKLIDDLKTDLSVIKPSLSDAFTLRCPNCNLPCSTIALLSNPSYVDEYNPDAANECQAISCPQCNTDFCMFCNNFLIFYYVLW